MTPQHLLMFIGAFTCLLGCGATGFWILNEQEKNKRWQARREETIGPYLRPKTSTAPTLVLAAKPVRKSGGFLGSVLQIFAYRPDRANYYPMPLPITLFVMIGPGLAAGFLATKVFGSSGWILLPITMLVMTRNFHNYFVAKASQQLLSQFPDALAMIARSVRVGVPVAEAVRVVSREALTPTREEFARAGDQLAIGVELESTLLEMAERNDLSEYRFFATALALQAQTGGGLTETLDILADTIRKREAARKRGIALASEARASIYVLSALPVVTGAGLFLVNPDYIGKLFTSSAGERLLAIAIGMLFTGWTCMQQIIKRTLS